jgi:thiol-disulfide isomerase/thioredoxin
MRRLLTAAVTCLIAAGLQGCAGSPSVRPEDVVVGNTIPNFSLESLDGKTVDKDSLKGEVVVLNFWASWCAPCASEIPDLKAVAAGKRAKVVAVALDEAGRETVKPFAESHGINYTVLFGDQEVFQQFNGVGIPYTLVLDRAQRIVKIYRGPVSRESLESDLRSAEQGAVALSTTGGR